MINVGPTPTGMIQPIFEERLRAMGNWLQINGEAIYESRPWTYQSDTMTRGVWYTMKINTNHNSSRSRSRINVFAIVLKYPYDTNAVYLSSLGGKFDTETTVELLGYPEKLKVNCLKKFFFPTNIEYRKTSTKWLNFNFLFSLFTI